MVRVDQDRNDGAEKDHGDLGPDADAEPDDDQRQQRHARHRVERVDEGAQHVLQASGQPDRQPERNGNRNRCAIAQNEFGCADLEVAPEVAIMAELPAGLRNAGGRGDEQRINEPTVSEHLPRHQQSEHRAAANC
jgi:hypothetical protein